MIAVYRPLRRNRPHDSGEARTGLPRSRVVNVINYGPAATERLVESDIIPEFYQQILVRWESGIDPEHFGIGFVRLQCVSTGCRNHGGLNPTKLDLGPGRGMWRIVLIVAAAPRVGHEIERPDARSSSSIVQIGQPEE